MYTAQPFLHRIEPERTIQATTITWNVENYFFLARTNVSEPSFGRQQTVYTTVPYDDCKIMFRANNSFRGNR